MYVVITLSLNFLFRNTFQYLLIKYSNSQNYQLTNNSNRYVQHHYIHQLNQTPNYEYLGHPVNAYHLVRHVASGWSNVIDNVMNDEVYSLVHDLGNTILILSNKEIKKA